MDDIKWSWWFLRESNTLWSPIKTAVGKIHKCNFGFLPRLYVGPWTRNDSAAFRFSVESTLMAFLLAQVCAGWDAEIFFPLLLLKQMSCAYLKASFFHTYILHLYSLLLGITKKQKQTNWFILSLSWKFWAQCSQEQGENKGTLIQEQSFHNGVGM